MSQTLEHEKSSYPDVERMEKVMDICQRGLLYKFEAQSGGSQGVYYFGSKEDKRLYEKDLVTLRESEPEVIRLIYKESGKVADNLRYLTLTADEFAQLKPELVKLGVLSDSRV